MTNRLTNNSRSTGTWQPLQPARRRASNNLTDTEFEQKLRDIITEAIKNPDTSSITKLLNAKDKIDNFCRKPTTEGRRLCSKVQQLHRVLRDGILEDIYELPQGRQPADEYITTIERFFADTLPTLPRIVVISPSDVMDQGFNSFSNITWNNVHMSYFRIGKKHNYDLPILTTLLSGRNKQGIAHTLQQIMDSTRQRKNNQSTRQPSYGSSKQHYEQDPFAAKSPTGTVQRQWSKPTLPNRKRERRTNSADRDTKSNKKTSSDNSSTSAYDSGSSDTDRSISSTYISATYRDKAERTSTNTRTKDETSTTEIEEDEEMKRMRARLETLQKVIAQNEEDLKIKRQRAKEQAKAKLAAQLKAEEDKIAQQEKEKITLEINEMEARRQEQETLLTSIQSSSSYGSKAQTNDSDTSTNSGFPNTVLDFDDENLKPPSDKREISTSSDDCKITGTSQESQRQQTSERTEDLTRDETDMHSNLAQYTFRPSGTPPRDNTDEPHPVNEEQRIQSPPYSPPQTVPQDPPISPLNANDEEQAQMDPPARTIPTHAPDE